MKDTSVVDFVYAEHRKKKKTTENLEGPSNSICVTQISEIKTYELNIMFGCLLHLNCSKLRKGLKQSSCFHATGSGLSHLHFLLCRQKCSTAFVIFSSEASLLWTKLQ